VTSQPVRPGFWPLLAIGIAAGLLSGLFGIGGGTIIVPALALWLGMNQKLAAGTSITAILPTAIVGAAAYGVQGNIDWIAAACLAFGMVVGAQIGTYLLARLPVGFIQWAFMGFLLVVIVSLWFVVPQREDQISMGVWVALLLIATGFVTGVLSGVLGVGGGIIVVPIMMLAFGSNDLVAKGSSLVMMIPGSISGTVGNWVRRNVDFRVALIVGISASACVPFSALLAGLLDPFLANVLFSLYLVFILAQMLLRRLRPKR
jgi:uncharacterized membrane protein YfcA